MRGGCLCGAVAFEVTPPLRDVFLCHCIQCRRWAGHAWAASAVPPERLAVTGEVRWFRSSDHARRGFCPVCGSSLFWAPDHGGHVSFSPGALEAPTGLRIEAEECLEDAGDYYETPA